MILFFFFVSLHLVKLGRMNKKEAISWMNEMGRTERPFLFAINYTTTDCRVWPLEQVPDDHVGYQIGSNTNIEKLSSPTALSDLLPSLAQQASPILSSAPESAESYHRRFRIVRNNLLLGNSYLVNLTSRIPIRSSLSLKDLFLLSKAKYKLWLKDEFVCFSPETFLQIHQGEISCCPMKGTIRADDEGSLQSLMADPKEAAEHATIVDLIRNDLSMVANEVRVEHYRYGERLHTDHGDLWQTSSRITGRLPNNYRCHLGDILFSQLPAGSITGAPKPKTMEIIQAAEPFDRGFYTGVMGLYQNGDLDSAVMIRFIDLEDGQLYFKAGGGITTRSDWKKEYEEVIEKIYVPR
ncbi:aminodeoxychorismate synthase component I [Prevotella sp. AGR2160]|uniref:aminodeoxychorismate synthase component I n=1 Tax=Prevotella sp. AGR2160 TaxID=1280674 RepID=UPI003979B1C1